MNAREGMKEFSPLKFSVYKHTQTLTQCVLNVNGNPQTFKNTQIHKRHTYFNKINDNLFV